MLDRNFHAGCQQRWRPYGYDVYCGMQGIHVKYMLFLFCASQPYLFFQSEGNFTALYNDTAVHSLPVTINIISNALYQMALSNPVAHINVTSLPWPAVLPKFELNNGVFSSVIIIGVALSTLPSGFTADIVKDRQVRWF